MVMAEQHRRSRTMAQMESVLAGLPEPVRAALESGDAGQVAAAVEQLSPEQRQVVLATLGLEEK